MNRMVWTTLLVVLGVFSLAGGQTDITASTQPAASQPSGQSLASLRMEAISEISGGDFKAAKDTLSQIARLAPAGDSSAEAKAMMDEFLHRRAEEEKARQKEYQAAVDKAHALIDIASAGEEATKKLTPLTAEARKVRIAEVELIAAPADAANYTAEGWYLARVEATSAKITAFADHAEKAAEGVDAKWADDVRAGVKQVRAAMKAFQVAAKDQKWESQLVGKSSLQAIADQSEELAGALDHLASMTSETPWRAALDRARLARDIAVDKVAFLEEPWVKEVIAGAQKQAELATGKKEWYKALGLYGGLSDLCDENDFFKDKVKEIGRHARVLALYGPGTPLEPLAGEVSPDEENPKAAAETTSAPATAPENKWKERVSGVDARMVRSAISEIEENYVDAVDYRKVLVSALQAIQVLGETPELAGAFPGLANEAQRTEFLKNIGEQIEEAKKMDQVKHLDVSLAFNRVGAANRRTVKIPDEVIDVEFTDGMLDPLDPFSSMIWPNEWSDFKKQTMGSFSGVGVQIQQENGMLKVVSPLEDTPAYKMGVQAGDFIVAIDGENAINMDIDAAVKRITGQKGTKVTLTIRRPGRETNFDLTLVRDEIHIQTVKGWKRNNGDAWDWMIDKDNHIGYLRITSFTRDTTRDLQKALADLKAQGAKALILDLRFNPGGLLPEATGVVDEFIRSGTIVSTKGRAQPKTEMDATEAGVRAEGEMGVNIPATKAFVNGDVAVLVNEYSASAAEIVSGALKDQHRAIVIGTRSFGKGSVQNLIPIRFDRAYLKLTTAHYYLPSGRCLHRTPHAKTWGVEPDVKVPTSPEQLRKWLQLRRETEIIQQRADGSLEKEMDEQLRADIQLDTALLVLRMQMLQDQVASGTGSTAAP